VLYAERAAAAYMLIMKFRPMTYDASMNFCFPFCVLYRMSNYRKADNAKFTDSLRHTFVLIHE
jgi:hypothetical protein